MILEKERGEEEVQVVTINKINKNSKKSKHSNSELNGQNSLVRLQKVIADAGITSRRKAEEYIKEGYVEVNGEIVDTLGAKVDPSTDIITVKGEVLRPEDVNKIYVLFHKPRCCVTTLSDPEGRSTVMDYLTDIPERIYPVGRLDYLSEGLLLLTNDGEIANIIMHPRHRITKIYEVKIFGRMTEDLMQKLRNGVKTPFGLLKPSLVRVLKILPQKTWLEFRLQEGKNREIRRLCEGVGITIDKLKRVSIAGLTIDGIAPGKYRLLTKKELFSKLGIDNSGWKELSPVISTAPGSSSKSNSGKGRDNEKKKTEAQKRKVPETGLFRPGKKGIKLKDIDPSLRNRKKSNTRSEAKFNADTKSKGISKKTKRRADDKIYMKYRSKYYTTTMSKRKEFQKSKDK